MTIAKIQSHLTRLAAQMCRIAFGGHFAVMAAALVLTAAPAAGAFKLYDTGTDNAGNLLAVTAPDPHWTITNPNNVVTTPIHEFSYPDAWVNEITTPGNATGWIRPNDTDLAAFPGVYPFPGHVRRYKTTFDLTGHDPTTAFINLRWAMDDVTTGIILNGNLVSGSATAPLGFSGWNPITINSGFVSGINTLEFLVGNVDLGAGMIVDFLDYGAKACGNWVAGRDMAANERVTATETQNPNATVPAWSYGYRSTLASPLLTPFTTGQHVNNQGGSSGYDGFILNSWLPVVLVNTANTPLVRAGMSNLNPGEIELHPEFSIQYSAVRWTAPTAGTYNISAYWRDINASNGNGASGNIVLNGTVIFRKVWANGGPGVSASFPSVSLAAGDHLDFVVGAEGNHNSDNTAFDATIVAVTPPQVAPGGFVLIPGGTFAMGDEATAAPMGDADEVPHSVNVSAFYLAARETTRAQWDETTAWIAASGLGYDIGSAGASSGTAHPMQSVNWWHAVKWCNARSEQKGLAPCYTDGVGGPVVRSGTPAGIVCDFTKNGYRLPTESEWEKAARGGIAGRRFSNGNTLAHTGANYLSDHVSAYDVSATSGFHPSYPSTLTAPTGSFPANPYGLHDMEGNVWEWCWDYYNTYPSAGSLNPQGVLNAAYPERVIRGGAWNFNAFMARSANRDSGLPAQTSGHIGFRIAQTAVLDPVINTPPCFALPAATPPSPTGTAWTLQSAPAGSWSSIACSADGQKVIASVQNGRIYVSQDHGLSWVPQTLPPVADWKAVCASSDGNTLAAAAINGGIWRMSGGVWTQTSAPVAIWGGLACSYDGQRLLASRTLGGLYTSGNGGASWTLQTGAPIFAFWQGVASSASGQKLSAATLGSVFASSDFGVTWTGAANGSALSDVSMSWDGSTRFATGSGDPLLRGINDGAINSVLAGPTTWSALANSWDGKVYGATASPGDLDVRDATGVLHHAVLNATWSGMACSADGNRFYATQSGAAGRIYTSFPGTSGPPAVEACSGSQTITNFLTKIQPGPACEAWQSVTFTVTNNNNALFIQQPSISSNGTLTYTPGTTAGSAVVTVFAADNGGTANGGWDQSIRQTFTITILPATPEISVSGNAVTIADGDATPEATDHTAFGSVISCTGTMTRTFSIANNHPCAQLLLSGTPQSVTLSGPGASHFSIIAQPSLTAVGPGAITTFQIRFNPTNVGLCTATVTIPNNDLNEAPYDFVINGTAVASTDACVASTTLSAGAYSPAWVPTTIGGYALGVSNAQANTTVTAMPLHPCSTMQVRINGGTYATLPSATASAALPLNVGTNTINVRVTAQDGTTIKLYTIIVTRSEPLPTIPCPVNLGLKNTGVDATGALLPAGAIDPGYVLEATALPTYVTSTSPGWLPNTALSQWISYQPNGGNNTAGGTYSYRQTFSLVGFNPNAVQITGRFASDNGSTLFLNGTQIAATPASSGSFTAWTNFTITTGFAAQQNTLEFRVTNDLVGVGSGLRVEMTASAAPVSAQVAWQTYQTAVNAAVSNPADRTAIIAFPSGDHDYDGLSNYLEIALGTSPISGSSMPQLTPYLAPLAGSGQAQQRLHLSTQVPAAVGIPVMCVASGDLISWVPALQVSSVPGNPGFNLVTWVAPASMPLNRAFMRLATGACH